MFASGVNMNMMKLSTCILGLSLTAACSGSPANSGVAPKVSNLTLSQTTVKVGKVETITGDVSFSDPDGDVTQLGITLVQGGKTFAVPKAQVPTVAGMTTGKVAYQLTVGASQPGVVEAVVVVYDAAGHASNALTATVTAE
jgi:hypothetical protein